MYVLQAGNGPAGRGHVARWRVIEMLNDMTQAQTDAYNREHCKSISESVEMFDRGELYITDDGTILENDTNPDACHEWGNAAHHWQKKDGQWAEFDNRELVSIGDEDPREDADTASLCDYLAGGVYDIEYRVSGRDADSVRSVRIMIACGGPNVYLDTNTGDVELYWWGDRARYPLTRESIDALNELANELYLC